MFDFGPRVLGGGHDAGGVPGRYEMARTSRRTDPASRDRVPVGSLPGFLVPRFNRISLRVLYSPHVSRAQRFLREACPHGKD